MRRRNPTPFEGPFAPMLELYVKQQQAIGYDFTGARTVLKTFDKFSKSYQVTDYELTKEIAVDWAKKRLNENERHRTVRIRYLQRFTQFLISQGHAGYVGETQRIGGQGRHNAYVFTHEEIKKLFVAADEIEANPYSPYQDKMYPLLYRMLYGCGFRISELLHLRVCDVDVKRGIVHVIDGKNGNERFVPMTGSLKVRCQRYMADMHTKHNSEFPFFFKKNGEAYTVSAIDKHFRELLFYAGIPYRGISFGPRVHDFRHTFICHQLNKWAREGADLTNPNKNSSAS